MSKFSRAVKAAIFSPARSVRVTPDTLTHEGGPGYTREPEAELFLLAVANMVRERSFYESGKERDARFDALVAKVMAEDPSWIARFVPYLRGSMNMRSASVVLAAEYVRAGGPNGRAVVNSALQRADEPAEMLGYWISTYGKQIPQPIKRGVADAVRRLYTERNALKYDGEASLRMGDVIELVHPAPTAPWQGALFAYLIAKRHKRERLDVEGLPTIAERMALDAVEPSARRARLAEGLPEGTTWEWASSWIGGSLDSAFWEGMIPNMGIFALVRNLRNFDDADISPAAREVVKAKLTDRDVIAKSRMFPLRFYAAHREVATTKWSEALDSAIELSLANVPRLGGRTLILVDVSGSMAAHLSHRSKLSRAEGAAVFAAALAVRAENADLVTYANEPKDVEFRKHGSILRTTQTITKRVGGGTRTFQAIEARLRPEHDRLILLTDEQAFAHGSDPDRLFGERPVYTFNLAGYAAGHLPSGKENRHTFGGLSDAGFVALPLLERGHTAGWPF